MSANWRSPIKSRTFSSGAYRYGFQGQEKDDEVKGEGNSVNYKYRMHDARLGRFFAVDPLAGKYAYNSAYAFSENRVIDGIELEGMEYIHYLVKIYANGEKDISVIKDYRGNTDFNYDKYSESFGSEGRGIKFSYEVYKNGKYTKSKTDEWNMKQNTFTSGIKYHGLFMGQGAVTVDGIVGSKNYNFTLKPIDGVDGAAKRHDERDAALSDANAGWLEETRLLESDKTLLKDFKDYYNEHSIDMYGERAKDKITGRPASNEAIRAAVSGRALFGMVVKYKEWKVDQIKRKEKNPEDASSQKLFDINDYLKSAKWYQFKRKARAKTLIMAKENAPATKSEK